MIRLSPFRPALPAIDETMLPENAAAAAVRASLQSGAVQAMRGNSLATTLPEMGGPVQGLAIWRQADQTYWLQFRDPVNLIRSPIADDQRNRIYWTGDSRAGGKPVFSYSPKVQQGGSVFPVSWQYLGIPAPANAPTIGAVTVGQQAEGLDDKASAYVYTYVNELGEESAPSHPSNQVITGYEGFSIEVTGLGVDAVVAQGRIIESMRLYRVTTTTQGLGDFRFVAQIPAGQGSYTDTRPDELLGESLPTANWDAPRDDLKGLGLTAYGVAYGFSGKTICMSEPFLPYAWPRDYELTTQYPIVAIGHYDTYLVVATTGNAVIVSGTDPAGMNMLELPIIQACASAQSMVCFGHSAIYAGTDGLVMASGASARVVTKGIFTADQWQAMNPASMRAVNWGDKYLCCWQSGDKRGGFIVDPGEAASGIVMLDASDWFAGWHLDMQTGAVYGLREDRQVFRFADPAAGLMPYRWRSKRVLTPSGERHLSAKVIASSYDNLTFRIWIGQRLLFERRVQNSRAFSLPNHSLGWEWQVEVEGTDTVRAVMVAADQDELERLG